jgi:hypothetical protein
MESADKEPLTTVNFTREKIFALLNLLSNDDCQYPIWNDIANIIRMGKNKDEDEEEKK